MAAWFLVFIANIIHEQAAIGLSNLKMNDSPAKRIDFSATDKENFPIATPTSPAIETLDKSMVEIIKPTETPKVTTVKVQEVDEPLLQENPHRFVLFPIKYHEVRVEFLLHVQVVVIDFDRYGKCTKRLKHLSGRQKKSTYPKISTIGVTE